MITPFPLINAVLLGEQEGKIYEQQDFQLMIHKAGFGFVSLPKQDVSANNFVDFALSQKDLPQYFHLYNAPTSVILACTKQEEHFNVRLRKRFQLKYLAQKISLKKPNEEFSVKQIEEADLKKLEIFGLSLATKFWKSANDFIQNSFGFFVQTPDGEPASLCYAASVSNRIAEIDVATLPAFQNKGLAKVVVSAFVRYCIEHTITANWDCFEENVASIETAKSLGFQVTFNYPFLSLYRNKN